MAVATFKCEFPRRQAMLSIMEFRPLDGGWDAELVEAARVPVLVWPIPTSEGLFMVEHQDGTAHMVRPESLTFPGSKELFDQYDWSEK